MCPNHDKEQPKLQLSSDGVSENLSTSNSLDVFSVKFKDCKLIYPLRIIKPLKKFHVDANQQLYIVLCDLCANDCRILQYIADNPKRALARLSLSHSSWFPCEYCFAKGTKLVVNNAENKKKRESIAMQKQIVSEKIETLKQSASQNSSEINKLKNVEKKLSAEESQIKEKKSNIVWPKSTVNAPPRTRHEIMDIIEKIENDQPLFPEERKGIIGRSLFLDVPNFNFVNDIPVEYLHCGCLGVIKKCVELTFNVGTNRVRETKRKLSSPALFNAQIHSVKFPRECNRRIRDLDFAVYKGQEFRNLLLFGFPLILNCIEPNAKERNMWLYLTFMIKACTIPSEEFRQFDHRLIERCSFTFYSLYQQLFGMRNCTYNTHMVGGHLLEIRFHGPLTCTSAFPFESFYSEMRRSFVPGTVSTLKQIMQNVLIKRVISNHKCKNDIYISPKESALEANNLVYTYERNEYKMYKVMSIENDKLICQVQDKMKCSFPETPNLPWDLIGVFKKGPLIDEPVEISRKNVKGKVVIVNEYLITFPNNILHEK